MELLAAAVIFCTGAAVWAAALVGAPLYAIWLLTGAAARRYGPALALTAALHSPSRKEY